MKNAIFIIIAILFIPVCFAETRYQHSFEFISNVDIAHCQTINRFYKERCEDFDDNSKWVEQNVERMIKFETRQIQYEIKKKPGRDF